MEFHKNVIEFVMQNKYVLLEPEKASNFKMFLKSIKTEYSTNNLNEQMVCDEFVNRILPHIFELTLDPATRRTLELMEFNTNYTRTQHGFALKTAAERLNGSISELDWKNLICFSTGNTTLKGDIVEPGKTPHTLLYSSKSLSVLKDEIGLQEENASLLSAALGKDFQLARGVYLTTKEIKKRLIEEKRFFENKGTLSGSLNSFNDFRKLLILNKNLYDVSVHIRNQLISERIE